MLPVHSRDVRGINPQQLQERMALTHSPQQGNVLRDEEKKNQLLHLWLIFNFGVNPCI